MHSEFEMSMMGELNFFLGLQVNKLKEGTFINQAKYMRDFLKRFNMEESKTMKTPMSSFIKLEKDEKGKSINSTIYRGMIGLLDWILEDWRLRFQIWIAFSFSRVTSVSISVPLHFEALRKGIFTRMGWVLVGDLWHGWPYHFYCRGVEICLDLESIYRISILLGWTRVSEFNIWPIVSYYEAFLIDSILTGRRIHLGYLMMMHMISCCERMTRVLPYGRFLTRVFKNVDIDLSPRWFLGKESRESTCIGSGTGTEPKLDIPPLQSMGISTLGTRIEELVVVSDTRFYSMEDRMDRCRLISLHSLSISGQI
ncbi:hypothetical protein AAG906_039192 [Vitis piasezkii]